MRASVTLPSLCFRVGPDRLVVRALARRRGVARPDHELALEVADLFAALVDALRLDAHDAAVRFRRQPLLEHAGLRVDRAVVDRRLGVAKRLDLEVGDAGATDVRNA